jgi:hypothetical protein
VKKKLNSLSGIAQTERKQFSFVSSGVKSRFIFAYLLGQKPDFEQKAGDKKNKFSSRMSRIRAGLRTTRTATRL